LPAPRRRGVGLNMQQTFASSRKNTNTAPTAVSNCEQLPVRSNFARKRPEYASCHTPSSHLFRIEAYLARSMPPSASRYARRTSQMQSTEAELKFLDLHYAYIAANATRGAL
jgi:hypothetical protein